MNKKFTEKELQTKFDEMLNANGSMLLTEDGQAFYNTKEGKLHASNYCANNKVKFFEVKPGKKASKAKKTTKK